MADLATSSAVYNTFGFVFEDAGTYVFSSSCESTSIIVLAVMGEDVRSVGTVSLQPIYFLSVFQSELPCLALTINTQYVTNAGF